MVSLPDLQGQVNAGMYFFVLIAQDQNQAYTYSVLADISVAVSDGCTTAEGATIQPAGAT